MTGVPIPPGGGGVDNTITKLADYPITSAGGLHELEWDSVVSGSLADIANNGFRAGTPGDYLVAALIGMDGSSNNTDIDTNILVNSIAVVSIDNLVYPDLEGNPRVHYIWSVLTLATDDLVTIEINTGRDFTVTASQGLVTGARFTMVRI